MIDRRSGFFTEGHGRPARVFKERGHLAHLFTQGRAKRPRGADFSLKKDFKPRMDANGRNALRCLHVAFGIRHGSLGFTGRLNPSEALTHRKRRLDPLLNGHSADPLEFSTQGSIRTRTATATGKLKILLHAYQTIEHSPEPCKPCDSSFHRKSTTGVSCLLKKHLHRNAGGSIAGEIQRSPSLISSEA